MSPLRRAALAIAAVLLTSASGCTAAFDNDGDWAVAGRLSPPAPKSADAVPVVVDSDLAPDDLVALAFLLRHPDVRVLAITVPTTGLVTCPVGVDLVADLMEAVRVPAVPVSCGETPRGTHGTPFPNMWSMGAMTDNGLERDTEETADPVRTPPPRLIARLATEHPGLKVVALGPMTELAATLRATPDAYARLGEIVAMSGVADGASQQEGIGEWNAAADPDALAEVLAGPVPVTLVPNEVAPLGPPQGMRAPVVGTVGVFTATPTPRFWDLATAGYFTERGAGETAEGTWSVELTGDPGRLHRTGDGPHAVVTGLDTDALDSAYRTVFSAE